MAWITQSTYKHSHIRFRIVLDGEAEFPRKEGRVVLRRGEWDGILPRSGRRRSAVASSKPENDVRIRSVTFGGEALSIAVGDSQLDAKMTGVSPEIRTGEHRRVAVAAVDAVQGRDRLFQAAIHRLREIDTAVAAANAVVEGQPDDAGQVLGG